MSADAHNHLPIALPPTLDGTGIDLACACGTATFDWPIVLKYTAGDSRITPAVGIHPWFIGPDWEAAIDHLDQLLAEHREAAVGEIGLDRTGRSPPFGLQIPVLQRQLELATCHDRPAVLHCVRCWGKLADLLESSSLPRRGFLLHSYTSSAELVPRFARLGARFSFSSAPEPRVLDAVPPDRLLTESDASVTNRRSPAHALAVADEIAALLGEDPLTTRARLHANYVDLFNSSPSPPRPR